MPMKIRQNLGIILLLTLLSGLSGCDGEGGPSAEELIAKSWKMQKMDMAGEPAPIQIMATASFNFNKNGQYEILMGALERGVWKLSEDKKILITIPNGGGGQEQHIDILKLEEEELVLSNTTGPSPIRMELVPVR